MQQCYAELARFFGRPMEDRRPFVRSHSSPHKQMLKQRRNEGERNRKDLVKLKTIGNFNATLLVLAKVMGKDNFRSLQG